MVLRSYQEIQATRPAAGVGSPNVRDSQVRVNAPITAGNPNWLASMIQDVGGQLTQVAGQYDEQSRMNAYLEGAASAGIIESEAELQTSPLTADWSKAGYRDTMGKVAMADIQAKMAADMKEQAQRTPEEFKQYIAERRSEIMPTLSGMSRQARSTAMGQLLMQDRQDIARHQTEHSKYIVDTKLSAISAQAETANRTLTQLRNQAAMDGAAGTEYPKALDNAAATIYGAVWGDPGLTDDVRRSMTYNLLSNALASDNVDLYQYLDNFNIDGRPVTTLVNPEDRIKLSNQYRDAMNRTEDRRSMVWQQQKAMIDSSLDNGTFKGTLNELEQFIRGSTLNGYMTKESSISMYKKYADMQHKSEVDGTVSSALIRGDTMAIQSAGKDVGYAMEATERMLTNNKATVEQRLNTWLTIGKNSYGEGYTRAGTLIGAAMAQMEGAEGAALEQHKATFATMNKMIKDSAGAGLANTRASLLAGIPEKYRTRYERLSALVDDNQDPKVALNKVLQREATEAQMSPSMKAARAKSNEAEVARTIDSLDSVGWLAGIGLHVSAGWNELDRARLTIAPETRIGSKDGWFSDGPTVSYYKKLMRDEMAAEASRVMLLNTGDSAESVVNLAAAGLASRTVKTSSGPLFLPQGTNVAQYFGVGGGNVAVVGDAIDTMLKETKADASWQLSFAQGNILAQQVDKNGVPIGNAKPISVDQVKSAIRTVNDTRQASNDRIYGQGKTVMQGGAEISYNGANTAAVNDSWMYDFRSRLIDHEGVRNTPYEDLSGKVVDGTKVQTVGVGVSSHNKHYPKDFSNQSLTKSFLGASNDAAESGAKIARAIGKPNREAFMLFSELAYQSGTNFLGQGNKVGEQYRSFMEAYKSGDAEAAVTAFKNTAAWRYSADPKNKQKESRRQLGYLDLIRRSMKG